MGRTNLPVPLSRAAHGRVLGGVCAGLAERWGRPVARVRGIFLLGSLLFGLGPLVYLACWLILPGEGEDGLSCGPRGIVVLAQTCGALIGLGALGAAGSVAAVFGFGWVVVALAAAILVGILASWPRVGPAWALLPIGALVLPSLALAAADISIDPQTESVTVAPGTLAELPRDGLRSGLGTLEVDLRRTALPASGRISLPIDAGVRRTLIALPHDRCVHVEVRRHPVPLVLRVARAGLGAQRGGGRAMDPGAQLFGEQRFGDALVAPGRPRKPGPTLVVDFRSASGGLVVRDYPDAVDPADQPDWPGSSVVPEERPDTTGMPAAAERRVLRAWRVRSAAQRRAGRRVRHDLAGPCGRALATR
jgi:phage shock protein PspC (stress-responsive transcriptional regulator)